MYRKNFFSLIVFLALASLFTGCALQQKAGPVIPPKAVDLNPKITSGQMIQKVEAFEVVFDATLSMNDIHKKGAKLNSAKALVQLFDETIPNLKLISTMRAFGQFTTFGDAASKIILGPGSYTKSALPRALAPITMGRGFSPLNAALDGATADLRSQSGRMAVVVFSDGEDMEKFDPVAAARRMKGAYGERICIYTVHIGENAGGGKLLQHVADAGQCGYSVTGDSIAAPAGMAAFVEKVFLETRKAEPAKRPVAEPAAVLAKPQPASIALNVEFDTNKAAIKPKYHAEIKRVADFMTEYPKTSAVIEGHTDNIGNEAANVKLSQRRAESIKAYLVNKFGIDGSRLKAVGYGPSKPIAGNATPEGRQQNRRVHAIFSHGVQ
jgi:OOP family OmpA-OmpF porin